MEGGISEWDPVEIVLRKTTSSQLSVKGKGKGLRYKVQLKLGTRHRKDSLHKEGRHGVERKGCPMQYEVAIKQNHLI
jgi:hypothetical protein